MRAVLLLSFLAACAKHESAVATTKPAPVASASAPAPTPHAPDAIDAIVDTDLGKKVVLVQWQGVSIGWWSRIFAAP